MTAPVLALLLLVGAGRGRERIAGEFVPSCREPGFRDAGWKLLWERGATAEDTMLPRPSELAADGRHAYVHDMGASCLVVFRLADGSVAWSVGSDRVHSIPTAFNFPVHPCEIARSVVDWRLP